MSFKKNNEGRVFFQSREHDAGAVKPANMSPLSPSHKRPDSSSVSNTQIVGLLRALNEKLQESQTERKQMRKELDYYRKSLLAINADQKDTTSSDETLKELEEARNLILQIEKKADRADQGMAALKTQMVQSLQQQSEFSKTLENTKTEQAKITRQVNKAVEDRSRFMRKIERIEEAVLQTQDALSAKAMVLLTDQGVGATDKPLDMDEHGKILSPSEPLGAKPKTATQNEVGPAAGFLAWVKQSQIINPATTAMLLLLTGLVGYSIYKLPRDTNSTTTATAVTAQQELVDVQSSRTQFDNRTNTIEDTFQTSDNLTPIQSNPYGEPVDVDRFQIENSPENMENDRSIFDDFTPQTDGQSPTNIDLNDNAQLIQQFDENPDALAAQLNDLEPSASAPDIKIAAAPPVQQAQKIIPQPTAPAPVQAAPQTKIETPSPKQQEQSAKALEKKIKRDNGLPDVIKDIQNQAYNGIPEAQHDLAAIYTAGHGGVKQDYKRASFWFEQAADKNIANAAYNLGVLYHQGLGTDKDIAKAIKWYQKAGDLNHPEAQYNLGIAYIEGIGVPYDPFKASTYFRNAANQNVTESAYNLGLIYENGLLGEPKPDEALMWYKTAADKGSPEAKQALTQLAKTLDISLDDVNRIADSMKTLKKTEITAPAAKIASTPPKIRAATPKPRVDQAPIAPVVPAALSSTKSIIKDIQNILITAGLFPGPADGQSSPIMRDAIRTYQQQNKLGVTGIADKTLLTHMIKTDFANKQEFGSRAE